MNRTPSRILIVDDEKNLCALLSRLIEREGLQPLVAHDGETALKLLRQEKPDMLMTDIFMPGLGGMELLNRAKKLDPSLPVVLITAYAELRGAHGAVEALRSGAFDYIAKPFEHHEVIHIVREALAERDLTRKLRHPSDLPLENLTLSELMGTSNAIGQLISKVNQVASSDFSVVIHGETGVGKELVARAIHQASPRAKCPFIPVDCGAIPENLLESELFGYEKGAFTSAESQKPGKFELARGGTLFLDEISNMPLSSQAKLLRALQEKKIYRVGGTKAVETDVRLVAAGNQDLETATKAGSFRQDLLYRLNEFTIKIPPLRERKEDILYLAKRFLDLTNIELNKKVIGLAESAVEALLAFSWPGNVRQLRSTIRRAVLLAAEVITERHFDIQREAVPKNIPPLKIGGTPWEDFSLKEMVQDGTAAIERQVLTRALQHTGWNKSKAARLLQMDYKTLHNKVKHLGINMEGE